MKNFFLLSFFILSYTVAMFSGPRAFAKQLSPIEFYRRCTVHLTGKPIPLNSLAAQQIKRGELDAATACENLLSAGLLNEAGDLLKSEQAGRDVLKTFTNFHRTWFSANTIEQIQDYSEELARGTVDIYDPNEPALALTRVLLARGAKFSEVLTSPTGVTAVRVEDDKIKNRFGFTVTPPSRRIYGNVVSESTLTSFRNVNDGWIHIFGDRPASDFKVMPNIAVGDLVGIHPASGRFQIQNIDLHPLGASTPGHKVPNLNYAYDFYKTQGAGVLGTPSFLLMNFGQPIGTASNGSTKLPRRWIRGALESFLCVDLPALREADIEQYLVGNSSAPFRNGKSCLQCHATMDQAAYSGRNLVTAATDYFTLEKYFNKYPLMITTFKVAMPSVSGWPSEPVDQFQSQAPTGKLYFRSATGALINQSVNGIAELGAAMANTDDFYTCAGRRYFEYFTGIHVPIYDRTNPANANLNRTLTDQDLKDRKFIDQLGANLRKSQSLVQMIKEIMASEYYHSAEYRP